MNNSPAQLTKILVVEDESIIGLDIHDKLEILGYAVPDVVSSGAEAIQRTVETQPDLILMDIMLEGDIDGVEAVTQIQTQLDIPIIYLTAYADEETLQRARITQPFGYLLKPFKARELRTTIEMALYKHQIERKLKKSDTSLRETLHNLEVHQEELHIQNEELKIVQQQLEVSRDKYVDLYDFAPVGYFTIGEKDLILEVNLAGAELVGLNRSVLLKQPFSCFIATDDEDVFYLHRKQIFASKIRQTCELKMVKKDGTPFETQLESVIMPDSAVNYSRFRTAVIDITERKQAEGERERLIAELEDALARVKTLNGLLPICSSCKKIRDDQGYWQQIERYISKHSEVEFSHGICPECMKELYPDFYEDKDVRR